MSENLELAIALAFINTFVYMVCGVMGSTERDDAIKAEQCNILYSNDKDKLHTCINITGAYQVLNIAGNLIEEHNK